MAVSASQWPSRPQHIPTPPICIGDAIEISYSRSYGVMASAFMPTRELSRSHAPASPRRTDDSSAKLHYYRSARYRMIPLVETRNYPERQMLPPVLTCPDRLFRDRN